jgi:hypothetical protein
MNLRKEEERQRGKSIHARNMNRVLMPNMKEVMT